MLRCDPPQRCDVIHPNVAVKSHRIPIPLPAGMAVIQDQDQPDEDVEKFEPLCSADRKTGWWRSKGESTVIPLKIFAGHGDACLQS